MEKLESAFAECSSTCVDNTPKGGTSWKEKALGMAAILDVDSCSVSYGFK
jgi:hypothetical protein